MIVLLILPILLVQSQIYENDLATSNQFLKINLERKSKYEQSRETVESTRESCLDEYRQSQRRQTLSPICKQYCSETDDCQQENEQSACTNPAYPPWPRRTLKFVRKFQRICYIRITDIVRYDRAEEICRTYGLQLAILDNIHLLEHLKQSNMFNSSCKGLCPQARGYYIGLKRQLDENNIPSNSTWIWSNNVTWTQNNTDCEDDYSESSFANSTFLCYTDSDGIKKVTIWNDGEPNNRRHSQFQPGEQCVEIIARSDTNGSIQQLGKLNDIPCNKPILGVICQMNDLKPINSTRFEYFANIIGFNESKPETTDLLANFHGKIEANLDSLTAMTVALENLLSLPSFTIEQASHIFNLVDQLITMTGQIEIIDDNSSLKIITNKLLDFLDLFPRKIQIENADNDGISFKYENLNISLVNIQLNQWNEENLVNDWFTIASEHFEENPSNIIELNMKILRKFLNINQNYRIIEIIFSNLNLFHQPNNNTRIISGIPIFYQIVNQTLININEEFLRFQIRIFNRTHTYVNHSCAYWSFDTKNSSWIIDDNCRFAGYINGYAQCYCKHLTYFALLMTYESFVERTTELSKIVEEFRLTFVEYIGIILSIIGLVIILITYLLFRYAKKNHLHSSLFMLCLSLLFVNCLYIPFSLTKPMNTYLFSIDLCNILGFFLHYFLFTSFLWLCILVTIQYMQFLDIFNTYLSNFFIKTSLIGWIVPFLFPLLVIIIDKNHAYTGINHCWMSHDDILLYITFLSPICLIFFLNLLIFLLTIKCLCQQDKILTKTQVNRSRIQFCIVCCCFITIDCTCLFGILISIHSNLIYQYLFCLSNSFQGICLFLCHVYLSKPKREFWRTFFLQRSHLSFEQHLNTLTRPIKFRFISKANKNDLHEQTTTAAVNPAFIETNGTDQERSTNFNIRPQSDFLYDRIQRAKLAKNSYA